LSSSVECFLFIGEYGLGLGSCDIHVLWCESGTLILRWMSKLEKGENHDRVWGGEGHSSITFHFTVIHNSVTFHWMVSVVWIIFFFLNYNLLPKYIFTTQIKHFQENLDSYPFYKSLYPIGTTR